MSLVAAEEWTPGPHMLLVSDRLVFSPATSLRPQPAHDDITSVRQHGDVNLRGLRSRSSSEEERGEAGEAGRAAEGLRGSGRAQRRPAMKTEDDEESAECLERSGEKRRWSAEGVETAAGAGRGSSST